MIYIYQEPLKNKEIKFNIEFSKFKKQQTIECENFILNFIKNLEGLTLLKEKYITKNNNFVSNISFIVDISNSLVEEKYISFLNELDCINDKYDLPFINYELIF